MVMDDLRHIVPNYWPIYFGSPTLFEFEDRRVQLVKKLLEYCNSPPGQTLLSKTWVAGNLHILPVEYDFLQKSYLAQEFYAALNAAPQDALSCLGAAAYEAILQQQASKKGSCLRVQKVNVRLKNHPDSAILLKDLKANCVGKLVTVRGSIVRASVVNPLVKAMHFTCSRCGITVTKHFADSQYSPPTSCSSGGCRSAKFTPSKTSVQSIDLQKVRLQEILDDDIGQEGRVPRVIDCELTEDLVNACLPGDVVTVCGIVKVMNTDADGGAGKAKNKNLFHLYVDAKSVTNAKLHQEEGSQLAPAGAATPPPLSSAPPNAQAFSSQDLEMIVKCALQHGPHLFRRILHSVCPSIYGHELVKAGITLSLFGGVQKHAQDKNRVPVRGDIHILVVGDPGLGKSQLLKSAASVAPRGVYVCGNSATSVGLTVAVMRDAATGDYAFEAGAMVLADLGLCAIDEFDKMTADHQALLEAMEQQVVSVAKAGLLANLSARTAVLAAANPAGGHYNRSKTVNENLKMTAALLSRFDLIFILLDQPNEALDQRLSEHVMALHAGARGGGAAAGEKGKQPPTPLLAKQSFLALGSENLQQEGDENRPLTQRLKLDKDADAGFEALPPGLLRKYIAYARQHVVPRLSQEAREVMQKFYLQLREHSNAADGTPITARQLESLVRLAEARARLELRTEITRQDALDVVEIMNESLYDKLVDEHGHVDFGRTAGMSKSKESKRFLATLKRLADRDHKEVFTRNELATIADNLSLGVPSLDAIIERLNEQGFLLKRGPGSFQVL